MIDLDSFIAVAKKVFPKSRIAEFDSFWEQAFAYASIDSNLRAVMFLAQVGHECQGFTKFEENLNYTAQRLADIWPSRFAVDKNAKIKTPNETAVKIQRKPELIGNAVYSGRMGNKAPGDGYKYRGRGLIMLTGLNNYRDSDNAFNMNGKIISNPDLLLTPYWGLITSARYWKRNDINRYADVKDIAGARKAINGGLIGLGDVTLYYNKISKLINNNSQITT